MFNDNFQIEVKRDGDQWCALVGENLQTGYSGFGDTPSEAIWNMMLFNSFEGCTTVIDSIIEDVHAAAD